MDHSAYKEQLSALLDGELDDAAREAVTAHLADCEECRAYFAELTALRDAMGDMDEIEPPEGFTESVMERLYGEKTRKTRRIWRRWTALAACAAAVVLLVNVIPRGGSGAAKTAPAVVPQESRSMAAQSAPAAPMEEAVEAAEEQAEAYLETELLFAASGADSGEANKSMDALAAMPEAEYGGVEPSAAMDAAREPATRLLYGVGARAWLAEHGWQGESGDWYADAADLRLLPEGLTLGQPLPDDFDGAVLVHAEEPPEEPVAEAVEEPTEELVAENTEPPTEAEEVAP